MIKNRGKELKNRGIWKKQLERKDGRKKQDFCDTWPTPTPQEENTQQE